MNDKEVTVWMRSSPFCFMDIITPEQWQSLTDEEHDKLIEAAKILYKTNPNYNYFTAKRQLNSYLNWL